MRLSSRPSRFRCWKCWSTMTPGRTPRPAAIWAMRCFGVAPGRAERDHVARHRRGSGRCPGDHGAVLEPFEDSVREPSATDRRRQTELVAAGQEDAGRVADGRDGGLVIGLRPGHGVERPDVLDAEFTEDRAVPLASLESQRGCGADDRDRGGLAPRERDESAQDDAVADLVLRAADDDDGSIGHRMRTPWAGSRRG